MSVCVQKVFKLMLKLTKLNVFLNHSIEILYSNAKKYFIYSYINNILYDFIQHPFQCINKRIWLFSIVFP